jgi:hypothetical protein
MYGIDYQHSVEIARVRNRSTLSAKIGNVLEDPEIDFTSLAKAFGCYGFGPYTRPRLNRSSREEGTYGIEIDWRKIPVRHR